jgi:2-dehydro-3-deoxyphosphooctonate aldolase (KDO 8-P synthase)
MRGWRYRGRGRISLPDPTDIHPEEPGAATYVDMQIPAFLCRQTDLITAARSGKWTNIRRVCPGDAKQIADKFISAARTK